MSAERARELAATPGREKLFELIWAAWTREAIEAAKDAQLAWLIANPDDFGMLEAGEDLAYAEEALEIGEREQLPQAASG